jgi:hypothetical protein
VSDQFRRDNHFVPRFYLKRWLSAGDRVWTYRLLVPHSNVPIWKQQSTRGLAHHEHLYSRFIRGNVTDEFEKWLAEEFEGPAEAPFRRAIAGAQLTPDDWGRLIRFVAAQDVRTPARFEEQMNRWRTTLPGIIKESLEEGMREIDDIKRRGQPIPKVDPVYSKDCPVSISLHKRGPGEESGHIKAEITMGRSLWLWSMKRQLEETVLNLHQHKWTILISPKGILFPTSDDPVMRVNYRKHDDFDFGGGWGSAGTEILLPLDPRHILYAQIGKHPPLRGEKLTGDHASLIRRLIVMRAHRMIFSVDKNQEIPLLRPRVEDATRCQKERAQWESWHSQQMEAERAESAGDQAAA